MNSIPSVRLLLSALLVGTSAACATLQQFAALRQVEFAIDDVEEGELAGVDLGRIRDADDFSVVDASRVAQAVAAGELPLSFTVNVRAENPPDNRTTARMVRFAWTLLLNDRETIDGVLDREVVMPPGEPRIIPLAMRLDLVEFFDGSASELLNIALRVAGADADPTEVKLRASPTVETPLGPIDYPTEIVVVSGNGSGSD